MIFIKLFLLVLILLITSLILIKAIYKPKKMEDHINVNYVLPSSTNQSYPVLQSHPYPQPQDSRHEFRINDPIREYDYRKLYDSLERPVRRVARHEMPPYYFRGIIDYPTQGYPDNFTQIGLLILNKGVHNSDNENNILRLFGRQEHPGSYRYEYYTMINSGLDKIKVDIPLRGKKEIYDDDIIHIKEVDKDYTAQLYRYDEIKYYPDII